MRFFAATFLALMLGSCAHAPASAQIRIEDPELAQRLGADERGMRQYVLVVLRTGPYTPASEAERAALFEGHFANIRRRADEGRLLVAGPIGENDNQYRGIFIFDVASVDEARALVATDPTVASGVFVAEFYPWYGSAALMQAPEIHRRIAPP